MLILFSKFKKKPKKKNPQQTSLLPNFQIDIFRFVFLNLILYFYTSFFLFFIYVLETSSFVFNFKVFYACDKESWILNL